MNKRFIALLLVFFICTSQLSVLAEQTSKADELELEEVNEGYLVEEIEFDTDNEDMSSTDELIITLPDDMEISLSDGVIEGDDDLQQTIIDYFALRGEAFEMPFVTPMSILGEAEAVQKSEDILHDEAIRLNGIVDFQQRASVTIINADATGYIEDISIVCNEQIENSAGDKSRSLSNIPLQIEMDVYEWIWLDYCYDGDVTTDCCGYGVERFYKVFFIDIL